MDLAVLYPSEHFQTVRRDVFFDIQVNLAQLFIYNCKATSLSLALKPPVYSTLYQFVGPSASSGHVDLGFADSWIISGSYSYHTEVKPNRIDCLKLQMVGKNPKLILHGFFIKYLLYLKENYAGPFNMFTDQEPLIQHIPTALESVHSPSKLFNRFRTQKVEKTVLRPICCSM